MLSRAHLRGLSSCSAADLRCREADALQRIVIPEQCVEVVETAKWRTGLSNFIVQVLHKAGVSDAPREQKAATVVAPQQAPATASSLCPVSALAPASRPKSMP